MVSTIGHNWKTLSAAVGQYLGYGDDVDAFSDEQARMVQKCVDGGYRRACFPSSYSWSWLRVTKNVLTTTSGFYQYDAPPEIANIEGPLTIYTTSSSYWPIRLVHEGVVRQRRTGSPNTTGRPIMCSFFHKPPDQGFESGKRLELWPTPDSTYTIEARCQLNPLPLSKENPYPLGGPVFGQLFLEACLAEAEQQMDDLQGVHTAGYQQQLAAALEQDKRLRSEFMGQMTDPGSPEVGNFIVGGQRTNPHFTVTYNGVEY